MRATALLAVLLLAGIVAFAFRQLACPAWADRAYSDAERHYQAGDVDKARTAVNRALRWNPRHAAAFALKVEIGLMLGPVEPAACDGGPYLETLSYDRTLVAMDEALAIGGSKNLQRVLELGKWWPQTSKVQRRTSLARGLLSALGASER